MLSLKDILDALRGWKAWRRIEELPERMDDLAERLRALEDRLNAPRGQVCPRCQEPSLMVMESKRDPVFGVLGGKIHVMRCSRCEFTEDRSVDR